MLFEYPSVLSRFCLSHLFPVHARGLTKVLLITVVLVFCGHKVLIIIQCQVFIVIYVFVVGTYGERSSRHLVSPLVFSGPSLSIIKVCRQSWKIFSVVVMSFRSSFLFYFNSFPLSAFSEFSSIVHQIFFTFCQLIEELYAFWNAKIKGQGHMVTLE